MGMRSIARRTACGALAALMLALSGCGTTRPTEPPDMLPACGLDRFSVTDVYSGLHAYRRHGNPTLATTKPSFDLLALSAGGQYGAYGAGFLKGWGKAGAQARPAPRASIDVVTGVSTGALLATHAFLQRDDEAVAAYTGLDAPVGRERMPWEWLWSDSLVDTAAKDALIERILPSERIQDVADRNGKGRFLYVGLVNMDTGDFHRIDMTRLAGELKPTARRDACYRAVVGASSAIQVLFAPKYIDGAMWADGGARRHLFITEPPADAHSPHVARRMYSIVHAPLGLEGEETPAGLLGIAQRSAQIMLDQGMRDSIRLQQQLAAGPLPFESRFASASAAAKACRPKLQACSGSRIEASFCRPFMQCLAERGEQDGLAYAQGSGAWLPPNELWPDPKQKLSKPATVPPMLFP